MFANPRQPAPSTPRDPFHVGTSVLGFSRCREAPSFSNLGNVNSQSLALVPRADVLCLTLLLSKADRHLLQTVSDKP